MAQKKRKTARLRASLKRKARKKQERKSGQKRVKGGRNAARTIKRASWPDAAGVSALAAVRLRSTEWRS